MRLLSNFKTGVMPYSLLLAIAFGALGASANELVRPHSHFEIPLSTAQEHYAVPGSTVAWADYEALRRDFPLLRFKTDQQIDSWIIENFAFISKAQTLLNGVRVNLPAIDTASARTFHHPPNYRRASIADVAEGGVVDLKGTGLDSEFEAGKQLLSFNAAQGLANQANKQAQLDELRTRGHSDGMMTLGEAIAEVTRQQAVQLGLELYNLEKKTFWQTVESYFVISLPVKILKDGSKSEPAAIYGRQAHWRGGHRFEAPKEVYFDDFGSRQGTIFGSLVDFGGVTVEVPELRSTFGDSRQWAKPDSSKPYVHNSSGLNIDAQLSNAWVYAHQTARYFDSVVERHPGEARAAVEAHVESMLQPIRAPIAKARAEVNYTFDFQYLRWTFRYLNVAIGNRASSAKATGEWAGAYHALAEPYKQLMRIKVIQQGSADAQKNFSQIESMKPSSLIRWLPRTCSSLFAD